MTKTTLTAYKAAVFAFVAKVAAKKENFDREALADGSSFKIEARLTGTIDGVEFDAPIDGNLTVGHASERAGNVSSDVKIVLANLFGKVNAATKNKWLADIKADYAANGEVSADPENVALIEELLSTLRKSKPSTVAGDVKANCATKAVDIKFN